MSIKFEHVYHTYSPNTPFHYAALKNINLVIDEHQFLAIVGHTGSGKSTLVQHINALLRATEGTLTVDSLVIKATDKKIKGLKNLRKYAGLVFQFPEYQLFEDSVLKDVAFGPKNFNDSEEVALQKAKEALSVVGIEEEFFSRSPFELSGGQKRRVAIAGIIALNPKILILDEPTAGLDPQGAKEMMDLFYQIYLKGTTVIMITHDMDNVINYASRAIVLADGEIIKDCSPLKLFEDEDLVKKINLEQPKVISFAKQLIANGLKINLQEVKDVPSLVTQIRIARDNK